MKFVLFFFALTSLASACPEVGVNLRVFDDNFPRVDTTAKEITIKSTDGTDFFLNYQMKNGKGKWCYSITKDQKSLVETCNDASDERAILKRAGLMVGIGGVQIPVRNSAGQLIAVITMQNKSKTLSNTTEEGATVNIIKATEKDGKVVYSSPTMRLAYRAALEPKGVSTNDLSDLERRLIAQGVSPGEAMEKYSITHHLYADMYYPAAGITGGTPRIESTLRLDKKEIPFAPIPRAPLFNTPVAEMRPGAHWIGKRDANGCSVDVQEAGLVSRGGFIRGTHR